jgi:putative ABC transport system permease protein
VRLHSFPGRNLHFHWRANLAVALGAAAGTAALTGALLVGDSMRISLREAALGRLGRVEQALVANRYFREALADELDAEPELAGRFDTPCPLILLRGGVTHAESRARVEHVNVLGVDARFWGLEGARQPDSRPTIAGRSVVLNERLADELGAQPGDDVLLRVGRPAAISTETLLGRRDQTTLTLRLTVQAVIPAEGLGAFTLRPRQLLPRNVYAPLSTLQRALGQPGRVNALLLAPTPDADGAATNDARAPQRGLRDCVRLEDLGLELRADETHNYIALESERLLIEPPVEQAALAATQRIGASSAGVLTYLANKIALESGGQTGSEHAVPYSTVAALAPKMSAVSPLVLTDGTTAGPLRQGEILLNEWAAEDLAARPGDRIRLSYYSVGPFGRLDTCAATFVLRGIVRLAGTAADPGFAPEYPGVTDADSVADWDPPFPIDFSKIRDKDEAYWERYRATPKAFISLADGQRLWAEQSERFGHITSLRLASAKDSDLATLTPAFRRELLSQLDIARVGLRFEPVREQALAASAGTTDFGSLFIGFSFFLIVSAALLVALLFRLGVERRASQIGTLLATGFTPRTVAGLLLAEGVVVAGIGAGAGLATALGYAWLMLVGLRTWWSAAVNAPFLRLEVTALSLVIGYGASVAIALLAILWSLRGLTRLPPRMLLAGGVQAARPAFTPRTGRLATGVTVTGFVVAFALIALATTTNAVSQTAAFFGSGTATLVACLAIFTRWLKSEQHGVICRGGGRAWLRLGIRNTPRHRGRSILTAALVAAATFVIVALQALRLEAETGEAGRESGTGGFTLLAESAIPLPFDLNTTDGRRALNITPAADDALKGITVMPFRLRTGDETSCLNLYRPQNPRIVGASDAMIARGGFRFGATLAETEQQRANPWTLLRRTFPDGAIPAIGDESAVLWQLHLGLGKDLVITDQRGRDVRLRLVALLKGSVLQGELVIAETRFAQLFPSISGHSFFLIETPAETTRTVEQTLERELTDFGFDAATTAGRLAELFAVQNTYLSTFQTVGGLGLILGTLGLAAVLLRNVWERRGELALMRAVGFSRVALGWVVLAENGFLVLVGLLAGVVPALVAVAPHLAARPESLPLASLALTVGAVFVVGMLAALTVLIPALRAPLLPALRAE